MIYIVIEIQSNNGVVSTLTYQFTDKNDADSKFHSILASASVSSIEKHSALILNDKGGLIRSECYVHEVAEEE